MWLCRSVWLSARLPFFSVSGASGVTQERRRTSAIDLRPKTVDRGLPLICADDIALASLRLPVRSYFPGLPGSVLTKRNALCFRVGN